MSADMYDSQIGPTQTYDEDVGGTPPDTAPVGEWGRLVPLVPDCAEVVLTDDKMEVGCVFMTVVAAVKRCLRMSY